MLSSFKERLQDLWVQNNRNRIMITVATGVVVILLLCGCLNLMGVLFSGVVSGLTATGPVTRPTLPVETQQAVNINPTFPLPQPTVYPNPNTGGGTPVPSSGTPPPTPTASPTPVVTPTPTDVPGGGGGGGNRLTYTISPVDGVFTAGQTNQIILSGRPGTIVAVSIFFTGSTCIQGQAPNDPVVLDASGNGTFSCMIPANLKGSSAGLQLTPSNGPQIVRTGIPIQ
jgi:hypothetical protein